MVVNFRSASSSFQQQSAPPHTRGRTSCIRSAAYRILYSEIPPHSGSPPCYTHHSPWPTSCGRSNKGRGGVSPRVYDQITPPKDRRLCTERGMAARPVERTSVLSAPPSNTPLLALTAACPPASLFTHALKSRRFTMQSTTTSMWKASRRTSDRHVRGDGSAPKQWVAYCIACEAAYAKYQEAATACNGEDEAVAKLEVVHPAEPLPVGPIGCFRTSRPCAVALAANG